MGFLMGSNSLPDGSISKHLKTMLLGQAVDLNMVIWILAIVNMEQCCKDVSSIVISYYKKRAFLQDLPSMGMSNKVLET